MARKTLIFGNGLGMALDEHFFHLDTAIGTVWEDEDLLDEPSRILVRQCLPEDGDDRPRGEQDLDTLQVAVFATDYLAGLKHDDDDPHWLTPEGLSFGPAVRKFVHETASQFHRYEGGLEDEFVDALAEFLHDTKSHVATVNYDNLLYQPLIDRGILRGYDGALVDGMWSSTGFAETNLRRKPGRNFGYYLHLHGSPLFVDRNGTPIKLGQYQTPREEDTVGKHIVLTHIDHKETLIHASRLLSTYWQYLWSAIEESEEIILFGYSGEDVHLNHVLREAGKDKLVRVVEWANDHEIGERLDEWEEKIDQRVRLYLRDDILVFRDW